MAQNDILKEDFKAFLYLTWAHLGLPSPTPVQYDIADYLQHGPRRKMVQAFRGVGKSWIYGAFVAWRLYCDPDYKMLIVSASKPLADSLSIYVKRLIAEMPILMHLQPRPGTRDSNIAFDVGPARTSKDPSVRSIGITGQITGSRANEILADDIESLNNSATEVARERLAEAVKEFDAVLKPGGTISYLGTPQSYLTMYKELLDRGYGIRIWPAQVPEDPSVYRRDSRVPGVEQDLGPYIKKLIEKGQPAGAPVDPKRFPADDLTERFNSYGRSGYALQFMLDTSNADALRFPLKLTDLTVINMDLERAPSNITWGPDRSNVVQDVESFGMNGDKFHWPAAMDRDRTTAYVGTAMYIDPSGRGMDETSWAVVKMLDGKLFVADVGGCTGGYSEKTMKTIVEVIRRYSVKILRIEANFGDGMFLHLLLPHLREAKLLLDVQEEKVTGQKELRIIDTLEPVMMQHRLIIDHGLIERDQRTATNPNGEYDPNYSLFYQMVHITRDRGSLRHDDRLEALAGAVRVWTESMALDEAEQQEKRDDRLRDETLKDFMNSVFQSHLKKGAKQAGRPVMLRLRKRGRI